jgi:hypothetical protein
MPAASSRGHLGIDDERGDVVNRRFLQQPQTQTGFAAPSHAHADGVRDQILRVVEVKFVRSALGGGVVELAEVEGAEFLEVLHVAISTIVEILGSVNAGRTHDIKVA